MKRTGILIILLSAIALTIDRLTQSISTFLGKVFCGERYLTAVDGVVGDLSCGFNMDMSLAVFLLALFVAGLFLIFVSRNNKGALYLKQ